MCIYMYILCICMTQLVETYQSLLSTERSKSWESVSRFKVVDLFHRVDVKTFVNSGLKEVNIESRAWNLRIIVDMTCTPIRVMNLLQLNTDWFGILDEHMCHH